MKNPPEVLENPPGSWKGSGKSPHHALSPNDRPSVVNIPPGGRLRRSRTDGSGRRLVHRAPSSSCSTRACLGPRASRPQRRGRSSASAEAAGETPAVPGDEPLLLLVLLGLLGLSLLGASTFGHGSLLMFCADSWGAAASQTWRTLDTNGNGYFVAASTVARKSSNARLNSSGLSSINQWPVPAIRVAFSSGNSMWSDVGPSMSAAAMAMRGP